MTHFLFATTPAVGHTVPALPIARTLVERGHDVRWYTGAAFADQVTATGATHCPMKDDDYSLVGLDGFYPERAQHSGLAKLRFDLVTGFAKPVRGQVRELTRLLDDQPAEVLVGDVGLIGGPIISELGGPPFVAFGVSVLGIPGREIAPFGLGLAPTASALGQARNALLDKVVRRFLFGPMTDEVNTIRHDLGLETTQDTVFELPLAGSLYLQLSTESFEYRRSDLPSHVHFVGPTRTRPDPAWQPPHWWDEVVSSRPLVLVNQGTVATDLDDLVRPAIEGLGGEDVQVLAMTSGLDPDQLGPVPGNVRLERFVPFENLMPYVDVFVTNGGYGGVQQALSHGVPIVGAGKTEDKIEVNARVAYSGVGVNLRTQTPRPKQVRDAVRRVLGDRRFALNAQTMSREIEEAGREDLAAMLIEGVARRHQRDPVLGTT